MNKNSKDLIYLAACAVRGIVPEGVDAMDVDDVLREAERHSLSAAAASALGSAGTADEQTAIIIAKAIRKAAALEAEKTRVLEALEEAGIWHMPLKGSVLKNYYPQAWMRQMVDCDVLVDPERAEDVRDIMERLGYTTVSFSPAKNHDVYHKNPIYSFEIHKDLFLLFNDNVLYQYYHNVKDRLVRDEDSRFGFHFTPEDFYVYIIAHEYKHFVRGGTGLRSLLDIFVFLKRFEDTLDWSYIRRETDRLNITDFEQRNRTLAGRLFSGEALSPEDQSVLDYMTDAGTYGKFENHVLNNVQSAGGGKLRYAFKRVFLPMAVVEHDFPLFYRRKFLLPFLPFYRLYKAMHKDRVTIGSELKILFRSDRRDKK